MIKSFDGLMLDIVEPKHGVDLLVDYKRKVVHVNVDGICVLRICRIPYLHHEVIEEQK